MWFLRGIGFVLRKDAEFRAREIRDSRGKQATKDSCLSSHGFRPGLIVKLGAYFQSSYIWNMQIPIYHDEVRLVRKLASKGLG